MSWTSTKPQAVADIQRLPMRTEELVALALHLDSPPDSKLIALGSEVQKLGLEKKGKAPKLKLLPCLHYDSNQVPVLDSVSPKDFIGCAYPTCLERRAFPC